MQIFKKRTQFNASSDAALVLASLGGDRDSFGEIVARYQSLLCSLAYSAVGDLKHSEDIAQEAFIEAWRKLDTLRDPEKLKAWLCGILRFKVSHYHRKEANQPVRGAGELEECAAHEQHHEKVEDAVIEAQQQALLWQTLEKLPQNYREPLILFYREHRSVEHVATELELSEATVKQRLSRGRKILQQAMVTFVEDALEKSKPGAAFTSAVLLAIEGVSPPAKAAALGTGALKVGSFFTLATLLTLLASLSGVIGSFFSVRAGLAQVRTQRERHATIKLVSLFFVYAAVFVAGMLALRYFALARVEYAAYLAMASQLLVIAFIAVYLALLVQVLVGMPRMRAQQRIFFPEAFENDVDRLDSPQREYRTRLRILGAPLVHFKLGMAEVGDKPAYGWIAGGDRAYGLLFAWGGLAVAPVSVGIVSVGLVGLGAVGLGIFAVGTVGIGVIGFGASIIGYKAYASLSALAWQSAVSNGFSIAREAAIGPLAFAEQVNNERAAEIANIATLNQTYLWVLAAIVVFVIVPAVWHSNQVRKRMGTPPDLTKNNVR